MRPFTLPLVSLLIAALSACATQPNVPDAVHTELVAPYQLDSGDQLRVIVFGQDDLSNTYMVDQAGTVTMPLIGAIPARGHTTNEIAASIETRLRGGYLRRPNVSVQVDKYRPFFAMGEVGAAGQYSFVPGMTVQQAIAVAGGFSPRADTNSVNVTRSIGGRVESGTLSLSDPVLPGDTITVRERLI
jgi:polysaccharide export outer membrane protein